MNEWFSDQLTASQKAALEAFYSAANLAFEGFQKLTELNLQAVKANVAETHKLLAAGDPQAFFAQQASPTGPLAERVQSYNRRLYDIVASTHAGFATIAGAQYEAHNRRVQALFDDVSKQAPAGSEAAVAALKKMMDSSNALYDSVNKTVRQAVTLAEGGVEAMLPRTAGASQATSG
ncbi:TIGR01841 family phasin [Paraburkholderia sp.]|jgi:phasin family protein|uniref:TIGR01841 family phasin n=1 Tax=Paraburkholderia sp. TaxID=1926495 RepID=UPI002F414076